MNLPDFDSAAEAFADAWASIDGKVVKFRADKADPEADPMAGYYQGFLADSNSMIERLERRGYVVVKK